MKGFETPKDRIFNPDNLKYLQNASCAIAIYKRFCYCQEHSRRSASSRAKCETNEEAEAQTIAMPSRLHVGFDWRQMDAVDHPRHAVREVLLQGFLSVA